MLIESIIACIEIYSIFLLQLWDVKILTKVSEQNLISYNVLLIESIVVISPTATFDREYRRAYEALTPTEQTVVTNVDRPPSFRAIFCRRIFKELELKST